MSRVLYFQNLEVHRFPGVRPSDGFSLSGLAPGVTVVYGPNGSGKTTIAKALQRLLWPGSSPEACHVNGNFVLGKEEWFVENEDGKCKYTHNGADSDGFSLNFPPPDQRDRYYLALHNLLQKNTKDTDFAEIITRESAGGYDISAVENELDFQTRPSNAGRPTDEKAKRKLKEMEELRSEISELHQEHRTLDRLKEKLERSRRAERKAGFFDKLIDYRKHKRARENLRSRLDSFPDSVEKMEGNEKERLANIDKKIARTNSKREKEQEKIEEFTSTLETVDLPEEGVSPGLIKEMEERTDHLEALEKDLTELDREIVDRRQVKKKVSAELSDEFSTAELKEIDIGCINDLAEFSREAEDVRTGLKAYRQLANWLREEERPALKLEKLREGKRYLEEWLREGDFSSPGTTVKVVNRVLGVLNLIGATLLAPLVNPFFLILLIPAGGFAWLDLYFRQKMEPRETHKKRYLELDLESPESWNKDSVRKLLRKLSRLEVDCLFTRKKDELLAAREEGLNDFKKRRARLEEMKDDLVDHYGVAPDVDEGKFYWLLQRLNKWKTADEELEGFIGKRDSVASGITELREKLSEKLRPYNYENLEDSADFRGALRDLKERKERFSRAKDGLREVKTRKEEADERLNELRKERKELFEDLDIEPEDRTKLYRYSEIRDEYWKLKAKLRNREAVCKSKLEELKENDHFDEDLLNRELAQLKSQREDLRDRADNKDGLFEKINRIEERIRGRKNKRELEMVGAQLDRALDELGNQLVSDYESLAGNVLLNYLREEAFGRSRPGVFNRAGEIFARVTRGENRLVIGETNPPSFKAVDTESGETKSLEELSSGTRLQLLLSVRMAFVEQQENGIRLPLLMDEVLANSDDVKASEVIDLALEFSQAGRQVFYFTAQGDEVARWREKLGESGEVSGSFIDLSEARGLSETIEVPEGTSFETDNEPPRPGNMSRAEYGEAIEVPRFDPAKGAGTAHLWYLVEDLEVLYRLLNLEIDTWGRFKTLKEESARVLKRFDDERLTKISELGLVIERYVEAWRVGRNRRIDRTVIERSGAVTENFLDEVSELVRKSNGDPEELIKRLEEGEVSGFRTRKKDELEDFLEEHDYINDEGRLGPEEIKTRLLSAFNPSAIKEPGKTISRLMARLAEF
ncbi:AAA family ATPase [Candidatus Bipolaricaulota bacterium]|nr:AAA family ATPase [Candidatus Bipolaricaulota bacterium]